jgi:hypothetical protein
VLPNRISLPSALSTPRAAPKTQPRRNGGGMTTRRRGHDGPRRRPRSGPRARRALHGLRVPRRRAELPRPRLPARRPLPAG